MRQQLYNNLIRLKKPINIRSAFYIIRENSAFKSIQEVRKFKLLGSELFDLLREELTGQYDVIYES